MTRAHPRAYFCENSSRAGAVTRTAPIVPGFRGGRRRRKEGVATSCLSCGCMMNWAHAEGPTVMLKQFGLIGGVGIVAGVAALYWVQPDTIGGQSLLFIVVFALVGGLLELIAVLLRVGNGKQSEES
jgi:hypothetical protein